MAGTHFDITANDAQFQQKINAVKASIQDVSRTAQNEGKELDALTQKITQGVAALGAGMGAKALISQLINIRGEFQKLEVSFKTMLGSKEKADALMKEAVNRAATTPFDLQGVANGYKQLLAYGFAMEDVTETMTRLGNVAAGLSIPLNDLVYLYGTTRAQGRLYTQDLNQFTGRGIPMIEELAKQFGVAESEVKGLVEAGKVGFPEVQKVIESLTNEGGKFYNLMAEQSKTLSGQISNLEDSISQMFNEIGKQTEGVLSEGISAASYLVEHYEQIGRALSVLVAAYGTYKTALIATVALHKAQYIAGTVKAFLDLTKGLTMAKKAQEAFNLAAMKNPYVLLASAIVAAGVAIWQFTKKTEEAAEEVGELEGAINSEQKEVNSLIAKLGDANTSEDERRKIIEELNRISPENFKNLNAEKNAVNDLTAALNDYNASAAKRAVVAAKQDKLNTLKEEKLTIDTNKASLQNDIMNAYQQVIQNFDDIKVRDNSIWKQVIDIDESKFDEFKERLQSLMLDSTIPFETKMTKINELLQTGEYDSYGESLKFSSKELDKLIELKREYLNENLNASAKAREIAAAERDIDVTKSNLNIDSSNLAAQEEEVKNYQNINTLIDEQRAKIKALNSEIKALRSGKSQSENILSDIEDKEKELQEAQKQLQILTGEKPGGNKDTKATDYGNRASQQADIMEWDNAKQQMQHEAELAKLRDDNLESYYDTLRTQAQAEHDHEIELLRQRRDEELKNAKGEDKQTIRQEYDRQETALNTRHESTIADINTAQENDLYKQKLEAYQRYAEGVIAIEEEKRQRIEEINRLEESGTITAESAEQRRADTETIAKIDTESLAAEIGIPVEEIHESLMGIVAETVEGGIETIMQQLPALKTELEALQKSGGDPNRIVILTGQVKKLENELKKAKTATTKVNTEQDQAGNSNAKWKKLTSTLSGVNDVLGALESGFGDMMSTAGSTALSVMKTTTSAVIGVIQAMIATSETGALSIKSIESASVILTIISAALTVISAITNAILANVNVAAKYADEQERLAVNTDAANRQLERTEHAINKLSGAEKLRAMARASREAAAAQEAANREYQLALQMQRESATRGESKKKQKEIADDVAEKEKAYMEAQERVWEKQQELMEHFAGTDLDGFADNLAEEMMSAFEEGTNGIESAFDDTLNNLMKSMIKAQLATKLSQLFKPVFDLIEEKTADGDLTDKELEDIMTSAQEAKDGAMMNAETYKKVYEGLGLGDLMQQQAETGGFQAMSQDTGNELNGRFTAIQVNTSEMRNLMDGISSNITSILSRVNSVGYLLEEMINLSILHLNELQDINKNTAELCSIKSTLKNIERTISAI